MTDGSEKRVLGVDKVALGSVDAVLLMFKQSHPLPDEQRDN